MPRGGWSRCFSESDFLPAHFLEVQQYTRSGPSGGLHYEYGALPAAGIGTGFLVSPTLLLTNNHVLPTADSRASGIAGMNCRMDFDGQLGPVRRFELDPADTFLTSPEVELDYTLIRVKPRTVIPAGPGNLTTVKPGEEFGFNRLTRRTSSTVPTGNWSTSCSTPTAAPRGRHPEQSAHADIYIRTSSVTPPTPSMAPPAPAQQFVDCRRPASLGGRKGRQGQLREQRRDQDRHDHRPHQEGGIGLGPARAGYLT